MEMHQPGIASFVSVVLVLALVIYRNSRPRKMRVIQLWIFPLLLAIVTVFVAGAGMAAYPSQWWQFALAAAAGIAAGIPLGLARGHHSDVGLGERPGTVVIHPSTVVMFIWLAAFAVRYGMRFFMPQAGPSELALTDGLLLFAGSSIVVANLAIFRKYEALRLAQIS